MKLIISYRRDDTGAITGRICDRLRARFGAESVYMDIDSNPLGVDYRSHIDESLKRCDLLLAVIGRHWLGAGPGARRIDDPSDLVRLEVTSALARGIRLVPLLIDETEMPSSEELPEDLRGLKFRQAFRVDSGVDFHHHLDRLCAAIAATPEYPSQMADSPLPRAKRDGLEEAGARPPGSVVSSKGENEKTRISGLAIAALLFAVPGPILAYFVMAAAHVREKVFDITLLVLAGAAISCGHLAIKRKRQDFSLSGNGLALIGLIIGYLALLLAIIALIGVIHDRI